MNPSVETITFGGNKEKGIVQINGTKSCFSFTSVTFGKKRELVKVRGHRQRG